MSGQIYNRHEVLCLHCETKVPYRIEIGLAADLDNYSRSCGSGPYEQLRAYCMNCGTEVWVDYLDDINAELYEGIFQCNKSDS